jgi:CoA:oxalate CoA-transferase
VIAAVQSLPDALDGPLAKSRDMVVEIPITGDRLRLVASPIRIEGDTVDYRPPPLLGEHSLLLQEEADVAR